MAMERESLGLARPAPPRLVSFSVPSRSFAPFMRLHWLTEIGLAVSKKRLSFRECRRSANLLRLDVEV